MNLDKYNNLHRETRGLINVHPIQRGGILTPEARAMLDEFGDGYSVCDYCFEARVDLVSKPPIRNLTEDVAEFLGTDEVRFAAGCRHAKFMVVRSMCEPGETMVLDSLAHYTSYLAAETSRVMVTEVPHDGYPGFNVLPESYGKVIDDVEDRTGNPPKLALLTHADYRYGNLSDATEVGKICRKRGVPFLLNTAYTSGIMPIDARRLNADFICGSGHKSWAASGPIGICATTYEYADTVFAKSTIRGNWSGRGFTKKEVGCFGCSPVFGLPVMTLMASFPTVVRRVQNFPEEVKKAIFLIDELEKIEGLHCMGQRPHRHPLCNIESLPFFEVSRKHNQRGYFLYHALKKRGIVGLHPGMTKNFKINTYGLPMEDVRKVATAFIEIARENDLEVMG